MLGEKYHIKEYFGSYLREERPHKGRFRQIIMRTKTKPRNNYSKDRRVRRRAALTMRTGTVT